MSLSLPINTFLLTLAPEGRLRSPAFAGGNGRSHVGIYAGERIIHLNASRLALRLAILSVSGFIRSRRERAGVSPARQYAPDKPDLPVTQK